MKSLGIDNMDEYIKNNRLSIIVKAGCSKNKIVGWDSDRNALRVEIKQDAEDGKANMEIIKFFSKLSKKNVDIISGKTNKKKVLLFK